MIIKIETQTDGLFTVGSFRWDRDNIRSERDLDMRQTVSLIRDLEDVAHECGLAFVAYKDGKRFE